MAKEKKIRVRFFRPMTIFFVGILIVSIGLVILIPYVKEISRSNKNDANTLYHKLNIIRINFTFNQGEDSLILQKNENGGWFFRDKPNTVVPVEIIDFIGNEINNLERVDAQVNQDSKSDYGLINPIAKIVFLDNTGNSSFMNIGLPTPLGSGYYIQMNSSNVEIGNYDQIIGILNTFYLSILPIYLSDHKTLDLTPQGP